MKPKQAEQWLRDEAMKRPGATEHFPWGHRALKVKRAVRFPFLDYSTLAKRKAACEAELDVNRRFAPALYRRVVPITRQLDGTLALDGDGTPVEWAVEMTRFDENQTLDHLADRGALDAALPGKLAASVAAISAVVSRRPSPPIGRMPGSSGTRRPPPVRRSSGGRRSPVRSPP